ncbi:MAG: iron chelate uptake ABC transporter family permease subunit [Marinovum sp.]|nr:iron chelate uptake ABC transporter family permease subunit [Marinovum sp.]
MSAVAIRMFGLSLRLPRRLVIANFLLVLATLVVFMTGLVGGTYGVGFSDLVAVMTNTADPVLSMVVLENRLPRLLTALGVGLAFGLSGEMIQTLLRNPLASPDIVGFTAGAGLGAVLVVAFTGATAFVVVGALIGGGAAATLLLLLTLRQGFSPAALIITGIGLTLTLGVVTDLAMIRLDENNAAGVIKWIVGSLDARSWADAGLVWLGLCFVGAMALWHQFTLVRLGLADDVAQGLGLKIKRARMTTIVLAVLCVALGVTAAGPLPFVAFVAGPIAHGLNGQSRPTIISAALVGALVTLLADRATQILPGFLVLPAGIFTALIGAPVLIWVLISLSKRRTL